MDYNTYVVLTGLLVGSLVGLTGLGGGVLLLPLLMLGLGIPPIVAVGTGAVFMFFTKIGGAAVHWRLGHVDWRLGLTMALGSAPGALIGVAFLASLRNRFGDGVNDILRTLIGILLVIIPLLTLLQARARKGGGKSLRERLPGWVNRYHGAVFTGLVGGILVGLTSIGSGSVIMLLLILFYRLPPVVLIGTDVFHAVIVSGVTGLAHLGLGSVDLKLVGGLLVGSIPGVLIGSKLTRVIPAVWLRRGLLVVLVAVGIRMV